MMRRIILISEAVIGNILCIILRHPNGGSTRSTGPSQPHFHIQYCVPLDICKVITNE